MPYKISRRQGEICVLNADTGKEQYCYPDTPAGRKKAGRLLYALRMNVPDAKRSLVVRFPWVPDDQE